MSVVLEHESVFLELGQFDKQSSANKPSPVYSPGNS